MGMLDNVKMKVIEQVLWAENELFGKSGTEKKAAVIKKLDDLIKLPAYLEWVDDMIIPYLIDQACQKLNDISAHSFKDVEFNDVDKFRIAEEMKIQDATVDKKF